MLGFLPPAEEELRDIISFDDYLITKSGESFLVKVSGDSMSGAGIMEGDLVIVEKGRTPKNGDIVLAEVDGEWTMKYFTRRTRTLSLKPQIPSIPPSAQRRN